MNPVQAWLARRDYVREREVLTAIRVLRPDHADIGTISRFARLSKAQTLLVLARLERQQAIRSEWADFPNPRRILYSLSAQAGDAEDEAAA